MSGASLPQFEDSEETIEIEKEKPKPPYSYTQLIYSQMNIKEMDNFLLLNSPHITDFLKNRFYDMTIEELKNNGKFKPD